ISAPFIFHEPPNVTLLIVELLSIYGVGRLMLGNVVEDLALLSFCKGVHPSADCWHTLLSSFS
ncbi:MAG: hypothetical protein ACRDHW_09245, partial [Ktedonobacteraceae bacterium]